MYCLWGYAYNCIWKVSTIANVFDGDIVNTDTAIAQLKRLGIVGIFQTPQFQDF